MGCKYSAPTATLSSTQQCPSLQPPTPKQRGCGGVHHQRSNNASSTTVASRWTPPPPPTRRRRVLRCAAVQALPAYKSARPDDRARYHYGSRKQNNPTPLIGNKAREGCKLAHTPPFLLSEARECKHPTPPSALSDTAPDVGTERMWQPRCIMHDDHAHVRSHTRDAPGSTSGHSFDSSLQPGLLT